MTNTKTATDIAEIRWVTPRSAANSYGKVIELFRRDAAPEDVAELFGQLIRVRGAHVVEIKAKRGEWDGTTFAPSGWFGLYVRGTDSAAARARLLLAESGLKNDDPNADHDHASCIARAASMGVPPAWAHTPETYLSM